MSEITYTQIGEYLYPNIVMKEKRPPKYGKYGDLRRLYLREHRRALWTSMLINGSLNQHLADVDRTARELLNQLMPNLAREAGATEHLKRTDPMKWVGLMNNCKAQAEEIIYRELIYR